MTVADRWFYFPMAGLLGILGILYQRVAQTLLKHSVVSVSLSIIVIFSLVLITILRNSDWQNAIKLYTHDIQISDNYHIEISLGAEYARAGAYQEALHSFERSAALRPYEYNLLNMGVTYAAMGNIERAKSFHKKALQAKTYDLFLPHKHSLKLYVSYAELMLFYDSTSQALSFTQTALRDYPDSSELWNVLALAKHKEHDIQGAMDAATKAYQLNPNNQFAETYTQFFNNGQPVNVFYDDKNFTF